MRNWLTRIAAWLSRPKKFYGMLGVVLVAFSLLLAWRPTESHIRITGLLLQLTGLYTILHGISATRKIFGLPSLSSNIMAWLRSFPKRHPPPITISGVGGIASATAFGRATVRVGLGPNSTLENRVHALERNFELIDRYALELQRQIDETKLATDDALSKERAVRQIELQSLSRKLELTETGGLDISLIGIVWLMLGLVISTASYELAGLFYP